MANLNITITDTEAKCLDYITEDKTEWATNAVTERARVAKEEIISLLVSHCNANSIALATGEAAQITQAFDLGVVQTAAESSTTAADDV